MSVGRAARDFRDDVAYAIDDRRGHGGCVGGFRLLPKRRKLIGEETRTTIASRQKRRR